MNRRISSGRRRSAAVLASFVVAVTSLPGAATAEGLAGSQGTDTSQPPTDSAVTVSGRPCPQDMDVDPENPGCGFGNLKFTVSQTKGLINQAVSVSWRGGRPPVGEDGVPLESPADTVYGNFLQIFQCWGDDDGTNQGNPGPPPEKCQFGGFQSNVTTENLRAGGQFVPTRVVSVRDYDTYDEPDGVDDSNGYSWKPFHAVDGKITNESANYQALNQGGADSAFWLNQSFNAFTTNEIPVARGASGSELFTMATGLEASGLGCGQRRETGPDGSERVPRCWLVIVPRSTGLAENPQPVKADSFAVNTSPLAAASWRNRIAVPLEFKPVDSPCAIGADERRIDGSELAGPAVSSWQPKLCATADAPPYSYSALSDERARQQLATAAPGAAGMAALSQPIDPASLDPENPAVYAPLSLSGVTIGFNIERVATRDPLTGRRNPGVLPIEGVRVARVNLTPRLVAKLLAQSYKDQFGGFKPPSGYEWYQKNPADLLADPDFVQFNPEFAILAKGSDGAGGRLVVELPTSDAASEVWRWILADPEAAVWLAGTEDAWGMQVNPHYSTNPALNPSGAAFGEPVPSSYPKSDPFCHEDQARLPSAGDARPRPLCMNDIAPYVNSMQDAALATRAASDGALTRLDFSARSPDTAWKQQPPQPPGRRVMLSVTDTASAARYGLQTAKLSRAGDNTPTRGFIAPDEASLLAGQRAMVESSVPGVLKPDPLQTRVAGAYPLTMLTYGATLPASLDAASRKDYAAFLDYAAGPGQVPGLEFGQLPPGYAPLPADLRTQTKAAAATLRATPTAPPGNTSSGGGNVGPSASASSPESGAPDSSGAPTSADASPVPGPTPTAGPPIMLPTVPPAAQAVLASVPTPKEVAGFLRFAVLIAVGLGLLSLLGIMIVDDRWFRALAGKIHRPPPDDLPVDTS